MNFYPKHIGDYVTATAHLSMLEDGAYNRLLDHYYSRERALPASVEDCYRIARAQTKAERSAVATVLREFFELDEEGHQQKRCNAVLTEYLQKKVKASQSAKVRWDKHDDANAIRTHEEGTTTRARPNIQEPVTKKSTIASVSPSGVIDRRMRREQAIEACKRMEAAGCGPANPSDAELLNALADGVTVETLEDCAKFTISAGLSHANPFHYAITVALSQHERRSP